MPPRLAAALRVTLQVVIFLVVPGGMIAVPLYRLLRRRLDRGVPVTSGEGKAP